MPKAKDEIIVSPVKLRRASKHRCVSLDEVDRIIIEESDSHIIQDLVYKDTKTKALYMIRDSRRKKVRPFNNNKICKLIKKKLYEKK